MATFVVRPVGDWQDITADLEQDDPPRTWARPNGVGAFQVSVLQYSGGRVPQPSLVDLQRLLVRHVEACGLQPRDVAVSADVRKLARASATDESNAYRFWVTVEAGSFLLATYTAARDAGEAAAEIGDCERMIAELRVE